MADLLAFHPRMADDGGWPAEEASSAAAAACPAQDASPHAASPHGVLGLRAAVHETIGMRLRMRFLEKKDWCAPATWTISKVLVRSKLAVGAKICSEESWYFLGFEFGLQFFPDGTPLSEDGMSPAVAVFVKQNPKLGPNVPRCKSVKGEVFLNGWAMALNGSNLDETLGPGLSTEAFWASVSCNGCPNVTRSTLFDMDTTITLSIAELILEDGTVLRRKPELCAGASGAGRGSLPWPCTDQVSASSPRHEATVA